MPASNGSGETPPQNLVILMSDEHTRHAAGCYGHPVVRTPNIDRLAAAGTRFSSAYTTVPLCVPARAAFAVGKYNHQIGFWDNGDPYDGSVPSWHHTLRERGHHVASIGKLHFHSRADDNGFSEELLSMHVKDGKGDVLGFIRDELPAREMSWKMARLAGPGESSYTYYDREIAARAQTWLYQEAPKHRDRPWVLFVSLVSPHFPLTAPPEHYYRYYNDPALPWPKQYHPDERPTHPFLTDYASAFPYDDYFETDDDVRRAVAGYYGLCSFMDEQVGKVLQALDDTGLAANTRVMYTSDHGDSLGARGLWGKSTLYEEAAGVPLILAGPDIPAGQVNDTPVSHVDTYPFILDSVGETDPALRQGYPGTSLYELMQDPDPQRQVLCEYHGMGSLVGAFMLRFGRYKYVHYVGYPPQLFDLAADPEEVEDLADRPDSANLLAEGEARLRALLDPEEVDAQARKRQQEMLAHYGGREAVKAMGDLGFSPPPVRVIVE